MLTPHRPFLLLRTITCARRLKVVEERAERPVNAGIRRKRHEFLVPPGSQLKVVEIE